MSDNPLQNFTFLVEIDGIIQAGFAECSGFDSSLEVIEYREGGDPMTVRKLPGRASYGDITLRKGVSEYRELYDWHLAALNGQLVRRNGSIILLSPVGDEKVRWNFFEAWPSRWEGPELDAAGSSVAVSTLVLACERIERAA